MERPRAEPAGHRDAAFGLARREGCTLLVEDTRLLGGRERACWDLPGGALRPGEDLPAALCREWREETGLEAQVGDLLLVVDGAKRRPQGPPLYTWRAFVFAVTCSGAPRPGAGIRAAAWVPDAEVAGRLDAPYHAALRRHLAGETARHARVDWVEPAPPVAVPTTEGEMPRRLLVVAAAAAVGDLALLARETEAARAEGETDRRLLETLLQVVPYAGYPRAITALGAVRGLLAGHADPEGPPADAPARGRATFGRVYGASADDVAARLQALDPVLARWTLEHAYGRVLAREGALTLRERELLAVAVLTALGGLQDPLRGHMRACLRLGASARDVGAVVETVPSSVGEGRREAARALLAGL
jgi:alkylhydroperoxidase/carboxymuconolactone decarboxylase family protein YurZ/ADP-ribose pyrophosphatase YjhB (NUDIX family)